MKASPVGKVLPDVFYVHVSALAALPPVLRVYAGCGQALVSTVDDDTILELHRLERKVAYMSYPSFDRDPHPALAFSLRADLRTFHVKWSDFRDGDNPPILPRKESFVAPDYPGYERFARLTAQKTGPASSAHRRSARVEAGKRHSRRQAGECAATDSSRCDSPEPLAPSRLRHAGCPNRDHL